MHHLTSLFGEKSVGKPEFSHTAKRGGWGSGADVVIPLGQEGSPQPALTTLVPQCLILPLQSVFVCKLELFYHSLGFLFNPRGFFISRCGPKMPGHT